MCSVAMLCSAAKTPRVISTPVFQLRNSFRNLPADTYILATNLKTYCKNVMTYYKF